MRPLRPAGLLAGILLLGALPATSIAGASPRVAAGSPRVAQAEPVQCGRPGLPPCDTAVIHIAKTAAPSTLPAGGGSVIYTYTVTNGGTVPLAGVSVSDDKCAPVTFVGGDTNSNTLLDLTETWTFACTMTVTATTTNTATATSRDAAGTTATATATATVTVATAEPCPPGSTDPTCVPPPCPPGVTGPNCTPPPPPPVATTLVYECFDVKSRIDPRAVVRLVTKNFGNDTVLVRRSTRMCEPALKSKTQPPKGAAQPIIFPNTQMSLDLKDPQGGLHTVLLGGTVAQANLSPGTSTTFDTEMLQLSLVSTAPLQVRQPDHAALDSFFDVFVDLEQGTSSPGRVGSFFDIFPEITLTPNALLGVREAALRLMPRGSVRFTIEPDGSFMLASSAPIPLLDENAAASGWTINAGTLTPSPVPNPNQVMTRVFECFALERGANPDDPYALQTSNFGVDRVMVHRATRLCEGAIKSRQSIPATAAPQPAPRVWECFDIVSQRDVKRASFFLTTRNFGVDPVRVLRPDSLCEEAMKIRPDAAGAQGQTIGQPTGRVLECFTIEAKTRNAPFYLWTRNFKLDTVRVGRGTLMCEPAIKHPLPAFTGN